MTATPSCTLLTAGIICACVHASGDVIGYWRFEDGGGATASEQTGTYPGDLVSFDSYAPGAGDSTGIGWSTNISGATIPQSGAANTGSIRLGPTAFVDLSNGQDMLLGSTFSIEFFMNPDQPVIGSPVFGFEPIDRLFFTLGVDVGQLVWYSQFQGEFSLAPADLVRIGQWQHVAFVVEPSEYTIYVNGQVQFNGGIPVGGEGPFDFPGSNTTGDRTIGGDSGTFRGYLDEFRISDTALTPDQFLIAIPEPSAVALVAVGVMSLALRTRIRIARLRRPRV